MNTAVSDVNPVNKEYGPPGSPIQGSRLVRDYCAHCGEAIRVSHPGGGHICSSCQVAAHPGYGTPFYVPDADANGSWANAVKALETI